MKQKISANVSNCQLFYGMYNYRNTKRECFLDFTHAEQFDASSLTDYTLGIDLNDCISQCYDGTTVMSGYCIFLKIQKHCLAHQLNLASK